TKPNVMRKQYLDRRISSLKLIFKNVCFFALVITVLTFSEAGAQDKKLSQKKIEALKTEVIAEVDKRAKMTQEMVDMIFSFGELGMQEFETSKYVTGILKENGFVIEEGISGIPTAWIAKW